MYGEDFHLESDYEDRNGYPGIDFDDDLEHEDEEYEDE
jgi:hypothetical protein